MSEPTQRYRLESRIATGGMGEVWRATDTVLGREVAVKLLKREYAGDPTFRSRFETEARNAAALHHPNVASVFDFGELPDDGDGPGRAFLVMELVRGEPLSALLKRGEPMPADTASDLVAQAADALAAAHDRGIVHRDVKPANLLVTPDRRVKITDFGIARAANAVALTQTGQVIGTPQYLSPEQAEGRQATPASDIYSLGVVLYECLAGRRPFDAESPIATALAHLRQPPPPLPDDVPDGLRATVATALAKKPQDRFATVRDLADALRSRALTRTTPAPVAGAAGSKTAVLGAPGAGAGASSMAASGAADSRTAEDDGPTRVDGRPVRDDGPLPQPIPQSVSVSEPERRRSDLDPGRRGLPGWLPWLLVAAVLLTGGILGVRSLVDDGSSDPGHGSLSTPTGSASPTRSPSASPSRSTSASPATVQVDESAYLGDPRSQARAALLRLGLRVREVPVANPEGEDAGTVAAVSPSGSLPVRSLVTLSYFDAPAPSPSGSPSGDPSSSASASPSPTATATGSSPGNGNGNGNSGGNGNSNDDGGGGNGGNSGGGGGGRGDRR